MPDQPLNRKPDYEAGRRLWLVGMCPADFNYQNAYKDKPKMTFADF
ncbi:hypothetical protein [Pseudomonas ovata]|nr:hypothetical protein [Pseudomonas ovata]